MQSLSLKKNVRKQKQEEALARERLLREYHDTLLQLRQVRAAFQQVSDPDLINACVFEMNALQERYAYLLERMRQENVTCLRVLRSEIHEKIPRHILCRGISINRNVTEEP